MIDDKRKTEHFIYTVLIGVLNALELVKCSSLIECEPIDIPTILSPIPQNPSFMGDFQECDFLLPLRSRKK